MIAPRGVTNFSGDILTGGTWQVYTGSTLRVFEPSSIVTNSASILIEGLGANFYRDAGTASALSGLAANTASGNLTLQNGASLTVASGFTNEGNLTVTSGAALNITGTFTQIRGATHLDGGNLGPSVPPVGSALSFDGVNDLVAIADSASLRPSSLTLQGWVNFSALPNRILSLFGKTLGSGNLDSYAVWYNSGTLYGGLADNSFQATVLAGFNPAVNTWYHVAFTFDNTTKAMALYVNGAAVASGTTTKTIVYDSHPLVLGADTENGSLNYFLPGSLDDVRLYSVARSQSQIQADVSQRLNGAEPELALYLPLDEGSGATANDATANANHGALGSGVTANQPAWLAVPSTLQVDLQGGILTGTGVINGDLQNSANVSPGTPTGPLFVNGAYAQSSSGTLNIELSGTTTLVFDQLKTFIHLHD